MTYKKGQLARRVDAESPRKILWDPANIVSMRRLTIGSNCVIVHGAQRVLNGTMVHAPKVMGAIEKDVAKNVLLGLRFGVLGGLSTGRPQLFLELDESNELFPAAAFAKGNDRQCSVF